MTTGPAYEVLDANTEPVCDEELEALIRRVYVDGGFTRPDVASTLFAGASIRRRGRLLFLRDADHSLVGTVIVVAPDSPARRIATAGEAEMHLLAVSSERRNGGLGRILVDAALRRARHDGYSRMVLWTQPTMHAAHRLYERAGFLRAPERDMLHDGRPFIVYQMSL